MALLCHYACLSVRRYYCCDSKKTTSCRASPVAGASLAVGDDTQSAMDAMAATGYQGQKIYLEYVNGGLVSTTQVAPMGINCMRSTILSKDKKFSKGAVKVYGPEGEILEVRDWVKLVKNNWLEKWRQYSSWYGDDGVRHSLDGMTGLLNFLMVVPIDGPVAEGEALRALVPFEVPKVTPKPSKTRKSTAKELE
jgi:hypothetical protein